MSTDDTPPLWERPEPESPCVQICAIHPQEGICVGCYRTLEEIAGWSQMGPVRRRALMAELPGRARLIKRRRGGREGREAD